MNPAFDFLRHFLRPVMLLLLLSWSGVALSPVTCPNCGSTPVPLPLSTAANCGDQLYKIRCKNSELFFDTLNNTYRISSITPKSQRLTIEPAPFLPNSTNTSSPGTTCVTEDISTVGIQLNSSLPFNITSSNTVLLLNCTDRLFHSPLDCSNSSGLCHTYIDASRDSGSPAGACAGAPICCNFRTGGSTTAYRIRIREAGCSAYRVFVNLNESLPVRQWPNPALELEWKLLADQGR
ncbi:unnamed protein product [Cuscuta europaea]|uniref:Wall-associated receptor kinase galacturonan-binding domain-containing protein n=1 Tax=Cuscuta europaea TaxID=41803 RepID=A0A9P0ZEU5_CUSEU|nr:unnamed protein product [Cuscuta europaea]